MRICIFEDDGWKDLLPLVYFRPLHHLRCGALAADRKLAALFPRVRILHHVRPSLREYLAEHPDERAVNDTAEEETLFINARAVASEDLLSLLRRRTGANRVYRKGSDVVAARLGAPESLSLIRSSEDGLLTSRLFDQYPQEDAEALLLRYPWEYVHHCAEEIGRDFRRLRRSMRRPLAGKVAPGAHLLSRKNVIMGQGSVIQPGAVIDAQHGPVVIGRNVVVMPNAYLQGPLAIGSGTIIKAGAKIYHGTSIGERCKVGGEVEASIIQSYSNKQHDGFLGHSYIASWVNLGADTNNSDLKNTYGTVRVQTASGTVDTGLQFVGLTMGDHSKTGINVMFNTGTVVGVSCNVYGAGLPPKYLPSFCWGGEGSFAVYALDKSMETARRVMARRDVQFTSAYEKLFAGVFAVSAGEREAAGIR